MLTPFSTTAHVSREVPRPDEQCFKPSPLPLARCFGSCACLPWVRHCHGRVFVRMLLLYPASPSHRMEHVPSPPAALSLGSASLLQPPTCSSHGSNFPCCGQIEAPSSSAAAPDSNTGESCSSPGWKTAEEPKASAGYPQRGWRCFFLRLSKWALDVQISQLGFGLGFLLGFVFSSPVAHDTALPALGAQRIGQVVVKLQMW